MPQKILIPLKDASEAKMNRYLRDRIRSLREALRDIHENRLPNWRRIYEAQPLEKTRSFPFQNASNLVVPIVAIHCDTLLARVMSAVLKTMPPWVFRVLGGDSSLTSADGLRDVLESFGQYVALEPEELDLARVYHEWFGEAIRYGASVAKSPVERDIIDTVVPAGADSTTGFSWGMPEIEYEGPRPYKIPFDDFFMDPSAPTLEAADFKAHRVKLRRHQLEERAFRGIYDKEKVKEALKSPDRTSPTEVQSRKESDAGVTTPQGYGFAEWDIYECWFRYRYNGHYVRVLAWYHERSETILRAYFNYYPDEPFVLARLFYRDDMWLGYGFCEILAMLQEEVSQIHNQRRDNMTVANTRVWRVAPDSKLHKGYRIFPSAMLPAEKDEIEAMGHGELSPIAIDEERLALDLAEKRSGVSAPMQGMGAGTNTKRGVYTAMGTLSLLQEGNTRTDLNISDIRYAHTRFGRLIFRQYAEFGIGDRAQMFGDKGKLLEQALEAFKNKRLALPIYASTASVNREVEKQNDMMLTNVLSRHYNMVSQMLGGLNNPMLPDNVKQYVSEAIKASNMLMRTVLKHFNYDEVERLVPEAKTQDGAGPTPPAGPAAAGGASDGTPPAGVLPLIQALQNAGGGKPQ